MRFEGVISKQYHTAWGAYYRDLDRFAHKIVISCDYQLETYDFFAGVHGKFGDDFCSGADPLTIREYSDNPEVVADIQVSKALLKRLANDDETTGDKLKELEKLVRSIRSNEDDI